jgi:hypothetical protein
MKKNLSGDLDFQTIVRHGNPNVQYTLERGQLRMKANFLDRICLITLALAFAAAGVWGIFLVLCIFRQIIEALRLL